ncbi:hypothetical protein HETIRDRAFT_377792 [Heterobasidion irregulare TC 32-1]|uniref:Uncharacterized protein n=1 Tax=Heterobasidion irregulare (strain TC 32-1) TaxID=747525 RepID=W4KMW9_HETIT|nr:uncharacterized protein HETIRDRAFT_377792 [Heterobasidion irregulare TC 32-1]ETW87054.1 hypothetical protein HETIRDRAFT_377792 [Heterobasidion irregulare TC 32-1]
MTSTSSYSASSSLARGIQPVLGPPALSSRLNGPSLESEIDFSPSVGNEIVVGAHPVPMSSNDGTTLDWAGSYSEDEKPDKRWSLRSKRKPKDKGTGNSSKDVVEKQKALYVDKLARIRQSVKHNTEKKAEITRQQLGRRYNLLFSSLNSNSSPLSPTQIVRWYSNVDPLVQADLDRAEPLTWIKHLRDRRGTKSSDRSTWHISALVAEEFVRLHPRRETMETIPENALPVGSPSLSFLSRQERSPSNTSSFDISYRTQLDASLSRIRLLDSAIAQNQRNRSLLQRVAVSVKEYDNAQTRMSRSLGLSFSTLPPELLDALSHDPAIVIGSTRLLKGWRAVEDIHDHIRNQQETIQAFLVQASEQDDIPPQPSILDHPLSALSRSLDALEVNRVSITEQSHKVAEALAKVKELHAVVKSEFNETVAHTSVVYPELSHIVALEESYKDHYQQFWELGMDALTFLLDTVTPVWRIYGKVIGIDIQDFLIIPWYRNEFTGEAKRYPILALPKRSLRHWIALILFFYITLATLLLQIRAALTCISFSRSHFIIDLGLQWMAVPIFWFALVIQWCAVAVEVCIVAAECGVVMWWLCWWAKIVD